jgi:hypothetical protein
VFIETLGVEKTCLDGTASVSLRLPLDTFQAPHLDVPDLTGNSTNVGDLSVILKYVLWKNCATNDLVSAGLAITTPTGPGSFAGLGGDFGAPHGTTFQPFLGYLFNAGRWFLHGFLTLDVPTEGGEPTLLGNDIGVGYFLCQHGDSAGLITAVIPTFEVHVNNPLNHRGTTPSFTDPAAIPDGVNLTAGVNFQLRRGGRLALGFAAPVTGPRPFDFEVLAQFRCGF